MVYLTKDKGSWVNLSLYKLIMSLEELQVQLEIKNLGLKVNPHDLEKAINKYDLYHILSLIFEKY